MPMSNAQGGYNRWHTKKQAGALCQRLSTCGPRPSARWSTSEGYFYIFQGQKHTNDQFCKFFMAQFTVAVRDQETKFVNGARASKAKNRCSIPSCSVCKKDRQPMIITASICFTWYNQKRQIIMVRRQLQTWQQWTLTISTAFTIDSSSGQVWLTQLGQP